MRRRCKLNVRKNQASVCVREEGRRRGVALLVFLVVDVVYELGVGIRPHSCLYRFRVFAVQVHMASAYTDWLINLVSFVHI